MKATIPLPYGKLLNGIDLVSISYPLEQPWM